MKKFFVAILILVTLFTSAFADGVWHYCDLCGREHSGTICPEQCIDPCSQNEKGYIHKWYDCPEYTVTDCWYCGERTTNHNANCCPDGDTVWNDKKGVFKTRKFANEDGARVPSYCIYCEYYGYHYSFECKKAPVKVTPAPTSTPKPTNTPTSKPTEHIHTKDVKTSAPEIKWVNSADVCYEESKYVTTYCTTCNTVISTKKESQPVSHSFGNDRICDFCRYEKECEHKNRTTEYLGVVCVEKIGTFGKCCILTHGYQETCNSCGNDVRSYSESEYIDHNYHNGACTNCEFVIKVEETKTTSPTATLEPTKKPTEPTITVSPVTDSTVKSDSEGGKLVWLRLAVALAATLLACIAILFMNRRK